MGYWTEIRNTYMETSSDITPHEGDLLASISIDAWRTADDGEEGSVIARVLLSLHGDIIVDYRNHCARYDKAAQASIEEAKEILRNHYAESQKPEASKEKELENLVAEYICLNRERFKMNEHLAQQISNEPKIILTMAAQVSKTAEEQMADPFNPDNIDLLHKTFDHDFPCQVMAYGLKRNALLKRIHDNTDTTEVFVEGKWLVLHTTKGIFKFILDPFNNGSRELYCSHEHSPLMYPVETDMSKVLRNSVVLAKHRYNNGDIKTEVHLAAGPPCFATLSDGEKCYITDQMVGEVVFQEQLDPETAKLLADMLHGNIMHYSEC